MSSNSMSNNNGEPQEQLVCVTGAGGFIGSWVVKELLHRGYRVRGTTRDPADRKIAHLVALEGAKERLSLCRADLLDCGSLRAAFSGCHGVFHISELVPFAVEATRNVTNAAADMGVQRLVFTSSYGAAYMNPNRSLDAVLDETCWSDYEFCRKTGNHYCCAKMMAEKAVTEEAAKRGLQLAIVVPSYTIGPMLQQPLNSSIHIAHYVRGTKKSYPNAIANYVDVRDVARAHLLVYEHPAARGRYLCMGAVLHRGRFIQMLKELFPQYPVTSKYDDGGKPMAKPYKFSSERLKDLGLQFTDIRTSLYEAVISMQHKGHLPVILPHQHSSL